MKQKQKPAVRRYRELIKKHTTRKSVLFIGGCLLGALIVAQLVYPYNRGLPLANVAGESVRLDTYEEIAKLVTEKFDASKLRLQLSHDKAPEYDLKAAGAEPNTEQMVASLTTYPLWQRFIPGSFLWQANTLQQANIYYSNQPLKEFAEAKSKELTFPPQNARLTIRNGRVEADEAVEGSDVEAPALLEAISKTPARLGETTVIDVPAKRLPASKYSRDFEKVRTQAEAALGHTVSIKINDLTREVTKEEAASWIVLADDEKEGVKLTVDQNRIKNYLNELNKQVGTPAGQTNITIVDGRETGRSVGAVGSGLAVDVMADQLAKALLTPTPAITINGQFAPIQPSVIFNSKYTTTQAGLQAYADDVARSKNLKISIQQLDGERWAVNARANDSIPSGSTYKLFVAMVLFDRIDKGEIHWTDPMLDTTVAGCFERMTVPSTNPCAEAWIAQFGRQYINDFIHARGFSNGTSFTTGSANQTTAADLTKYMIGLNNGTLVGGANRDSLLDSLGRHPYRYGIPTGSAGIVHDKVGFLWDYVHDTAIVQHPRGNYIMTIMTKGQSYATIAAVTREVERIMYP